MRKRQIQLVAVLSLVFCFIAGNANAACDQEDLVCNNVNYCGGWFLERTPKEIGVANLDGHSQVYFEICTSKWATFNSSTDLGKQWYALLLSARASGTTVDVKVRGSGGVITISGLTCVQMIEMRTTD